MLSVITCSMLGFGDEKVMLYGFTILAAVAQSYYAVCVVRKTLGFSSSLHVNLHHLGYNLCCNLPDPPGTLGFMIAQW